jgi:hypothetical protein
MTPTEAGHSMNDEIPRIDAMLDELRDVLVHQPSGRIVLSWHWPKREVRYEVTVFRHPPPSHLARMPKRE